MKQYRQGLTIIINYLKYYYSVCLRVFVWYFNAVIGFITQR